MSDIKNETNTTETSEEKSFPWVPVTLGVTAGVVVGVGATYMVVNRGRKAERAELQAQIAALQAPTQM